jgi:hypothetical protein
MAIKTWGEGTDGGSDGDWNTAENWTDDTLPQDGDTVVFSGDYDVEMSTGPNDPVEIHTLTVEPEFTSGLGGFDNSNGGAAIIITNTLNISRESGNDDIYLGITFQETESIIIATESPIYFQDNGEQHTIKNSSITISGSVIPDSGATSLKRIKYLGQNNLTLNELNDISPSLAIQWENEDIVQENTGGDEDLSWTGYKDNDENWIGQTFQVDETQSIESVTVYAKIDDLIEFSQNQIPDSKFRLEIYETDSGLPTGSPIAQSEDYRLYEKFYQTAPYDLGVEEEINQDHWPRFFLTSPIELDENETYAFVLRPLTKKRWISNDVKFWTTTGNAYSNGSAITSTNDGGSWSEISGKDLEFKIHKNDRLNITANDESQINLGDFDESAGAKITKLTLNDESFFKIYQQYTQPVYFICYEKIVINNRASIKGNVWAGSDPYQLIVGKIELNSDLEYPTDDYAAIYLENAETNYIDIDLNPNSVNYLQIIGCHIEILSGWISFPFIVFTPNIITSYDEAISICQIISWQEEPPNPIPLRIMRETNDPSLDVYLSQIYSSDNRVIVGEALAGEISKSFFRTEKENKKGAF